MHKYQASPGYNFMSLKRYWVCLLILILKSLCVFTIGKRKQFEDTAVANSH